MLKGLMTDEKIPSALKMQKLSHFTKKEIVGSNQYRLVSGKGTQPLLEEYTDELHYAFEYK